MKLLALHAIYLDSGIFEASGRYDAQGNAFLVKVPKIVQPGSPFEINDAEGLDLCEREAARELDAQELELEGLQHAA